MAHEGLKQYGRALDNYEKSIEIRREIVERQPEDLQAQSYLEYSLKLGAWLLATCPEEQFRNGRLAVLYAQQACDLDIDHPSIYNLRMLAAAHAANNDFETAIEFQTRAIEMAGDEDSMIERMRANLELLKQGKLLIADD